jgi:hypothetical protein
MFGVMCTILDAAKFMRKLHRVECGYFTAAGEYLCKTALKEKIYLPFIIFFLTHKKATIVIPTLGN